MRKSNQSALRQELRQHADGATVRDLARVLEVDFSSLARSLKAMPDAYIDRWVLPKRGPLAAVWAAVKVPENCPKPADPRSRKVLP